MTMEFKIPKNNLSSEQIKEIENLIFQYQFEFDTPETRIYIQELIDHLVHQYIADNRDKKIDIIIDATTTL